MADLLLLQNAMSVQKYEIESLLAQKYTSPEKHWHTPLIQRHR